MTVILLYLALASWTDQCAVAVYDYDATMCYVEDANPDDATCSEYREYGGQSSYNVGRNLDANRLSQ